MAMATTAAKKKNRKILYDSVRESRKKDAERGKGKCYKTLERIDVFGQMASGLFSRHRLPPMEKWLPAVSAVESTANTTTRWHAAKRLLSYHRCRAEAARLGGDLEALIG